MKRFLIAFVVLVLASAGVIGTRYALAQDEESGRFVRFVERQISTPDRRIKLGPLRGALSSDVRLGYITIADRQGVWLRLDNVHLVWSRLALLRGRLSVDLLEAEKITVSRKPLPVENDTPLEEGADQFELPSLPVSVILRELKVPEVDIAEGVIGPAAKLSVDGNISLAGGELDTDLAIERLDRPGDLNLKASFDNVSRNLSIDFTVAEPEDGVIANALDIEGKPPLSFSIKGDGPLAEFKADIALVASDETLLSGTTTIDNTDAGFRFIADISGDLSVLVPPLYAPFVGGGSEVKIDATRAPSGAITIAEGRLKSGVARLDFTADVGADGVPTALSVDGELQRGDNEPIALPGGGGDSTVRSAIIKASLGGGSDAFSAEITLTDLDTALISAPQATIKASGTAANLGDAASRAVTFEVTGGASGMDSDREGVGSALGAALDLAASGAWNAGEPVTVRNLSLETETVKASFAGTILDAVSGRMRLATDDISAFAAVTGRDLSGSIDIAADGNVGFDGTFDLVLDGNAANVTAGIEAVDGLMEGRTRLSGRAARSATGIIFDTFRLENPQLSLNADGRATTQEANLRVQASLADLGRASSDLGGDVSADLSVTGNPQKPAVKGAITSTSLTLSGQTFTNLAANFDGTYTRSEDVPFDLDGSLDVTGALDGGPVAIRTRLESGPDARALQGLTAQIAGARLEGDVALQRAGTVTGNLDVSIPDLSRLASLAMQTATGSIDANVTLSVNDGNQVAAIDGTARGVVVPGVTLTEADLDLVVDNVFGIPALDGRANLRELKVAGFDIVSAALTAQRQGETSNLSLDADLGSGDLSATGALSRTETGFSARIATLRLSEGDFVTELRAPTEVTVEGEVITIGDTRLAVGDGTVAVAGRLGEELQLTADIENLPLGVANLIRPDLETGGTVSGKVDVTGTRDEPDVTADVQATGVTAALLKERGIDPLTITARGTYIDGVATLQTFETNVGGGEIRASGTVGDTLDVTATVSELPLALANALRPELEISGTLSGEVTATGTLKDPDARFDVRVVDADAKPLRDARLEPLNVTAVGTFADGTAQLQTFETTVGGGRITASGTIGEQLDVTAEIINLPLALAEAVAPDLDASGTLSGNVSATGTLDDPSAQFSVEVKRATVAPMRSAGIEPLDATARGSYAGKVATLDRFETTVGGGAITAAGTIGDALDVTINVDRLPLALANTAVPDLGLAGTLSGRAEVTGAPSDPAADFSIEVRNATARLLEGADAGAINATIAGRYADGAATLSTAQARLGDGTLSVTGSAGPDRLDLTATLERIPLAIANGFAPELGVTGALSGRATAQGSPGNPQVTFQIDAPQVSAAPIRDAGLPSGSIRAAGTYRGSTLTLGEAAVNLGGGSVTARGTVGQRLDIDVTMTQLPLAIANGFASDLGLTGRLSGTATATGPLSNPAAQFNVSGTGISALPLQDAGVGALTVTAAGRYANGGVDISSARAEGSGLSVTASGFVPLSGGGLNVSVDATAPLSLANRFLAARATTLEGTVVADIRATGSLANPSVTGSVRASPFSLRDPLSNLTLANGQLSASLDGNRVVIQQLSATLGDGTISVTGSIGLGAGFPADLRFVADNARYADGRLVAVTLSANLGINGPLVAGPTVVGNVDIDRAEITVPTRLSGTAALMEVTHFYTPPDVLETLRFAEAGPYANSSAGEGGTGASGLNLDVTINAPRRIFVRGRGIDAELGGQVRVTGPISDIQPVGEFNLIRGRINILTQRIELTEGRVTLFGDLDPVIHLIAETSRNSVTVRVVVDGPANDPQVRFESTPDLPQDEVLSQLIFGRSIDDLSAFQLAQLAAAVGELAGVGTGPSIIDQVRAFSGLDNLEIVTTESGGTAVEAGRYIADNVYVGVRAGARSTGITVNVDITRGLKARAETFTDESTLGLYYEREY
ncbi:translocation/assembly module TamB domain-containing protein [Acuticoccus sp. I52.16.1]|uniref:translocation/assembly module TamB domain-containing protein n=1 Tax=Acuticoccus sp. I52.16.1 TaxID=2928472 RepID=UPI001FD5D568|nr:translocation/assembly module TamB domain-containing protein [Acuticoccus sp. I52.16.1]UOM36155.1 translocation/assembly module TamB domain-containing protein [Acuticoccus sp. I52.16.1]